MPSVGSGVGDQAKKPVGADMAPAEFNVDSPPNYSPVEVSDSELKKESVNDIQTQTLTQSTFSRDNSCHKCGTLLAEKQATCPNCKSPRRAAFVNKEDRKALTKKGPFGFQLWLSSITNSRSKNSEVNYFVIMCYIVSVLFIGSGIAFMIFAGIAGIFVGAIVGIGGFCLFMGTQFWSQSAKNPRTPIPWIGNVAWSMFLYFIRQGKFKKFKASVVLDKYGLEEPYGDRELISDPNLNKYKVIDLEGTDISDAGLLYLYDLRGIQYLVVRNTNVTSDAVHDLHQTIPKTWIWY